MKVNRTVIASAVLVLCACVGLGYVGGYYDGTGLLPTVRPPESLRPPGTLAMATAIETEQALVSLQDKDYGNGYNCVEYAWDAMRLLRWQGQTSALVGLDYDADPELDHALLLVPTEDKGWIFIDPQIGKQLVNIVIGGQYAGHNIKAIYVMVLDWIPFEDYIASVSHNVSCDITTTGEAVND